MMGSIAASGNRSSGFSVTEVDSRIITTEMNDSNSFDKQLRIISGNVYAIRRPGFVDTLSKWNLSTAEDINSTWTFQNEFTPSNSFLFNNFDITPVLLVESSAQAITHARSHGFINKYV